MSSPAQQPSAVANTAVRQVLDQMNSSIDLAHKALVLDRQNPKVPEEVFVALFLPYFSGQELPADRNVVVEWVSATGSAMSEADIVDTEGKVLYTVPSMMSTDMLKLTRDRVRGDFAEIVAETQMISHQSGAKALNYADQASAAKVRENVDQVKAKEVRTVTEERWGQIFDRYGIGRVPGEAAKTEVKPLSDGGQDDVVYD